MAHASAGRRDFYVPLARVRINQALPETHDGIGIGLVRRHRPIALSRGESKGAPGYIQIANTGLSPRGALVTCSEPRSRACEKA